MSVKSISSSDDFESTIKNDGLSVIWVYDSDGANRGFGKQYEGWIATEIKGASFYKAGTDDIKEAIKSHGLTPDWVAYFKNGKYLQEVREDHNAVYQTTESLV